MTSRDGQKSSDLKIKLLYELRRGLEEKMQCDNWGKEKGINLHESRGWEGGGRGGGGDIYKLL